jgi:hypothetical protein
MPELNPFNEEFCSYLEYHLTRTFAKADDRTINRIWCDGIAVPFTDSQISKPNVNHTQCVITKAWIGYDGQQEYEMTIKLGSKALHCYNNNVPLIESLPSDDSMSWVRLDIDERTITLDLY